MNPDWLKKLSNWYEESVLKCLHISLIKLVVRIIYMYVCLFVGCLTKILITGSMWHQVIGCWMSDNLEGIWKEAVTV